MSSIYFISVPCGCGKTTLTNAYAEHLVKAEKRTRIYVIHGDDFHHGFVGMYEEDAYCEEEQGHLYDNTGKTVAEEVAEISKNMEKFLVKQTEG